MHIFGKKNSWALILAFSLIASPVYALIKVGTVFFEPPFVTSINQGFNIDLIHALCQGMKEQCQVIPMDFNKLFTALDSGDIDLAFGVYVSENREKRYIFSLPYIASKVQFLVLKSKNINSIDMLKGKKVGLVKEEEGGLLYEYLIVNYGPSTSVVNYDDMEDVITALNSDDISAALLHKPTVQYWEQNSDNLFVALGQPINLGDGVAIMALPENAALIQRINQQLQLIENNNVYLNIYNVYFSD